MAEGSEFDLNYITERIIAVTFLQSCSEQTYEHSLRKITQMLQSKHSDQYMVSSRVTQQQVKHWGMLSGKVNKLFNVFFVTKTW